MKVVRVHFIHTVRHNNKADTVRDIVKERDLQIELEAPFLKLVSPSHVTMVPLANVAYLHVEEEQPAPKAAGHGRK